MHDAPPKRQTNSRGDVTECGNFGISDIWLDAEICPEIPSNRDFMAVAEGFEPPDGVSRLSLSRYLELAVRQ
ncbi:Uncharacterised protein [Mycobacteroides abscessus subsp. bolletii]|nr:Uncharacterised protein [Mycobacteroides abscessus subsp. bolletii]